MSCLVSIHAASFGYGNSKNPNIIVSSVDFSISLGEFVLLVGPNGCGKSTIIRGLFDLVPCFSGHIEWFIGKHEIGYIPQEATIDFDIPATALDVVCTAQPQTWSSNKQSALAILDQVGMRNHAYKRFGTLSGGQKRRILLGRALFGNPKLLVLDEPTVNTDRETEKSMETLLSDLCMDLKVGIVATTHSEHWARHARRMHVDSGVLHA